MQAPRAKDIIIVFVVALILLFLSWFIYFECGWPVKK
jgi:hypothetical protein